MSATLPDFGTCWGTPGGTDLSMPSYMASGFLVVAEAILRRWSTGRGELIDDPNYGYNLTDLVNADLSPSELSSAQQQAAAEAVKDERVRKGNVTMVLGVDGTLAVTGQITTAQGQFKMVVAVSAATTQLLLVQP